MRQRVLNLNLNIYIIIIIEYKFRYARIAKAANRVENDRPERCSCFLLKESIDSYNTLCE